MKHDTKLDVKFLHSINDELHMHIVYCLTTIMSRDPVLSNCWRYTLSCPFTWKRYCAWSWRHRGWGMNFWRWVCFSWDSFLFCFVPSLNLPSFLNWMLIDWWMDEFCSLVLISVSVVYNMKHTTIFIPRMMWACGIFLMVYSEDTMQADVRHVQAWSKDGEVVWST